MRPHRSLPWIVLMLLATPLFGFCQDEAAPEIDRTDPAAVASAYITACRTGDTAGALALLHPEDPLRAALVEAAEEMGGEAEEMGFSFGRIFTEFMFVPMKMDFGVGEMNAEVAEDGTAQVTVKRTWAVDQKLIMSKAEDGTWSIKVLDSVKLTTGSESSFIQMQGRGGNPNAEGAPPQMRVYDSERRLRRLGQAFQEYAKDHDSMLPPAATWVDALQPYVLDPEVFQCPGDPEQEYGYAMNLMADEIEMPRDWNDKRKIILVFEWRGAERNATAMPDELIDMESFWPDGAIVYADASGNTRRMPQGTSLDEIAVAEQHRQKCEQNVRALTRSVLKFARENDGLLPGPDTWQDDIALYLLDETGVDDVFRCPAADEIDFAYAINSAVAGMDATEIRGHERITLFFESDLNVANASGDPLLDAAAEGRHLVEYDGRRRNTGGLLSGSTTHLSPATPAAAGPVPEAVEEE